MKKLYFLLTFLIVTGLSFSQSVIITRVVDGGLPSDGCSGSSGASSPKAIELYVDGTVDFTNYTYDLYSNGGTSANSESLADLGSVSNQFVYIITLGETTFDEIVPGATKHIGGGSFNGDDTITITSDGSTIVDQFGVIGTDGTGEAWEYLDSYAKRNDFAGPNNTFTISEWTLGTVNEFDGTDCPTLSAAVSFGTYTNSGTPCGVTFGTASYVCSSNTIGDNNDDVTIQIPYTGSDSGITSVTTTSGGSLFGDEPTVDENGTVVITGLSEGDAWDVTLNGGNCDGTTISGTVPSDECDPIPNTCFDLSGGAELFEIVTVESNSDGDVWTFSAGTYSMNGFCGTSCTEASDTWLIFGPLDMTGVSDLALLFDAVENFDGTDLNIQYTSDYSSGCPSSATWTPAQTIIGDGTGTGNYSVDLSAATGTDVFIGIQYLDSDGFPNSGWDLSNVELASFGTCPTLGTRPTSDCATCDLALQTENYVCLTNTAGDNNDGVTVEIPYSGSEDTITSLSTTSGGTIAGDDPATVVDGTITITGLSEGDAWDLTINGGDCDGTTISGTIPSAACDPPTMDLVINEILADPDSGTGDANGDGTVDTSQDEFVELFNIGSTPLDISGYTYEDGAFIRHTFPASTIIPAGEFLTLFGGGTPTGISGISQTASAGTVGLNNSGDTVIIRNGSGVEVVSYTYGGEAGNNQSIAREPDFTGAFVQHLSHSTNPVQFSPGAKNDGTALSADEFEISDFKIYPNPTNTGIVNIMASNSEIINAEVFDILGKQVMNQNIENNQLNVSNLNAGVYILRLTQNNASITKKLVIQ